MDPRVFIVAAMIIGAGLIGGVGAFLTDARPSGDARPRLYRYLVLGMIAAASVPLFLSLVQSNIIQQIFDSTINTDTGLRFPPHYESYLIFLGICLLAAFSARKFIDSVSKQVLRRLDEVQETAQGAAVTAANAKSVAQDVADEVEAADENVESELPEEIRQEALADPSPKEGKVKLTALEAKILSALSKRTYRTQSGIAQDAGIPRSQISDALEGLAQRKLALPTKSPSTGGLRWIMTRRGEAALSANS